MLMQEFIESLQQEALAVLFHLVPQLIRQIVCAERPLFQQGIHN